MTNKLGGVHAVVALTQDSINFQLAQLHKRAVIHPRLQLTLADTGVEIDAVLAPPTIVLSVPHQPRTAVLTLPLPSGKLTYWEGYGPKAVPHTLAIADWRLAFRVHLDFQEIAAEHVRANAAIPTEVKQHLEQFSPDMFTIRHLFLDFENAQLLELDPVRTQMPLPGGTTPTPGVILQIKEILKAYVLSLRGAANPYILGYAIDVKPTKPVDGPLAATSGSFSTFADPHTDGMNALNFLLMMHHEALPTAPSTGLFESNWVRSNKLDGRLVIAQPLFWGSWLLPQVLDVLGPATATDGGWTLAKMRNEPHYIKDLGRVMGFPIDVTVTNRFTSEATIKVRNASDTSVAVNLAGTYIARRQYEAYPLGSYAMFAEIATVRWSVELSIVAGADGALGVAASPLQVEPTEFTTDGNWLGKMEQLLPSNRELLAKDGTQLADQVRAMLGKIKVGQVAQRIVMPTGSTMFLKNVQIDDQRNVLVDIAFTSSK